MTATIESAAAASIRHWDNAQVAVFPRTVTAAQSRRAMERRNAIYPGLLDLMPTDLPGATILDFGCGPGHDTIGFLLNGAEHVFAADTSWQGLTSIWYRLCAHGFEDRCTLIRVGQSPRQLPIVEHVHCAGVLHHVVEPVETLAVLADALDDGGEIRLMVYAAESEYVRNAGGPDAFELIADGAAPIARAWTRQEVKDIAQAAGLYATYLGGYLCGESDGPGLGGCWSLRREVLNR